MKNKDKIILDLCGGSGAWSRPYKETGYTVYNITLPYRDVLLYEMREDYIYFYPVAPEDSTYEISIDKIYGILAAPSCTQFSLARTTAKTPRDLKKGMENVKACLNIIWQCQYNHKLTFWALENPVGLLRRFLGRPSYTFQPYEFGEMYTKRTDIWGFFNKPKKRYKEKDGLLIAKKWESKFGGTRKAGPRSVTPAGFARAFYEANK